MELKWDSESRNRRRFFLCAALSSCHLRSDLQYSAPDTFSLARSLQVLYSKSHPRNTDIPLFGHLTWSEMQLDIKKKKKKKFDQSHRIWCSFAYLLDFGNNGRKFFVLFCFFLLTFRNRRRSLRRFSRGDRVCKLQPAWKHKTKLEVLHCCYGVRAPGDRLDC